MFRLVAILILLAPIFAQAKPLGEQWFSVLLDGRKIGSYTSTRLVKGDRVTTEQSLNISFDRAGTEIALGSSETSIETLDGKPIGFSSTTQLSGTETRIEGQVANGTMHLRIRNGTQWQERDANWPQGALLAEGLRLASLKVPLETGRTHEELAFQPSSLDAIEVVSTVGRRERVSLPGGSHSLYRIEQIYTFAGTPVHNTSWIDNDRNVRKLTMPAIGVDLTMLECSQACATAANQSTDIFQRTLMPSPRPLGAKERQGSMRYTIAAIGNGPALHIAETSEQQVQNENGKLVVTVHAQAFQQSGGSPEPADRLPNDWLQSTAPEIVALANKATDKTHNDSERMHALESFVANYITDKNLSVGYASALQVARDPQGDCTEHAVLLAALGRALGIATRVVDGLVYSPSFGGERQVFVPHAWIQAWVEGRWRSFDAALGGFDAGHIAFSSGDGDPWRFYQGLDLLGRTRLTRVDALEKSAVQ